MSREAEQTGSSPPSTSSANFEGLGLSLKVGRSCPSLLVGVCLSIILQVQASQFQEIPAKLRSQAKMACTQVTRTVASDHCNSYVT